ncbi:MAG TPA: nodulation protein NfeD, partial [Armatimonadota bacterium]|nr:nodulation protein NfeD [Armatimonadota bacterium]
MQIKILAVVFLAIWLINSAISAAPQPATVHVLTIDGTIEPTVAQYVQLGIQRAEKENASAVLIELRTPGGLVDSTRDIVTEMLNTNVPVIVYVSPNGARAGSAGVFITMAGHVAAMAPVSNIGSAHPVLFGTGGSSPSDSNNQNDVMMEKVTNDAAKYIVAIAEKRGRNKEWAEKAVRESANITASEAVKLNVVDFIAENEREVLRKADGMKVEIPGGEVTLAIKDARLKRYPMPWYKLLLHYLADPEVAFILMLIAIYGIIFEINTPGVTLPGIVGGVAFILFLYSLSVLPVNYAGLILILAGIGMMIADIKVASHGVLSVGGAISFFFGAFSIRRFLAVDRR